MDRKQVDFGREKEVFPLVLIQVKSAAKRTVFDLKNKREKTFLPFKTQLFHIQVVRYAASYSGDFWTKNVTFIFFASDKKSFFFSYFCDQQIGNQVGKTLFLIKSEIPGALASGCSGFLQRFCKYTVFEYILCFFVIQRYWKRLLSCCLSLIVDIRCGKDGPRRLIVRGLMVRNVRSLDTGASDVRSFNRSGLYSVVTIRFASSMRQGSISSR